MRINNAIAFCLTVAWGSFSSVTAFSQTLGVDGKYVTSVVIGRDDLPHTFWLKGFLETASMQSLTVRASYNVREGDETVAKELVPYEQTETYDDSGRVTGCYVLLTEDDWRSVPAEKTALTFVCTVKGRYDALNPYNNMFSLGHAAGRERYPEQIPPGSSEDNAYEIAPVPGVQLLACDSSNRHFSGAYYLAAELDSGRKYMFGVADADFPFTMRLQGSTEDILPAAETYTNEWTDCSSAYVLVPKESGKYVFTVSSGAGAFTFKYAAIPDRTPAKHEHGMISTSYPATFSPGFLNDPVSGCYDEVIDQCLYEFSDYSNSGRYVFRTTGADTNLLMRLYDSSGAILAENTRLSEDSLDVQLVWSPNDHAAGSAACGCGACPGAGGSGVYVGVCQPLGKGETPTAGPVTLSVVRVEESSERIPLFATPDIERRSPFDDDAAQPSAPVELNAAVWSRTFVVQARAGITYRVKAAIQAGGSANGLTLAVRAFDLSGTTAKALPDRCVSSASAFDPAADGWMEFSADSHCAVGLEVSVADGAWGRGRGLDYGPFSVCVTSSAGEYGVLRADMFGAADGDMGWKIVSGPVVADIKSSREPYYPAGGSVILPPGGPYVIAAKSVADFQRADSQGYGFVYVKPGKTVDVPRYEYYDKFDPADDLPRKAAKLSPRSGKAVAVSRSLWKKDSADWFSFKATEGAFYRFSFPWKSLGGDAEVRVYGPGNPAEECSYSVYADPASEVRIIAGKGTYYVKVSHADAAAPVDSSYTLQTLMSVPGLVKLSRNQISVKESDGYADVVINRTGSDGRIRVRYRTEDVTAVAGEDYYAQEGEFVWENGDRSSRTVRIKLIPRMIAEKRNEARSLKLSLSTATWDEVDCENEFIPGFDSKMGDTAIVEISETGKVMPGEIRLADGTTGKSPVYEVTAAGAAGEAVLSIPFERVCGSFGEVAVQVAAVNGGAVNGVDFAYDGETLSWAGDERGGRTVNIRIFSSPDDAPVKSFTLKLTASGQYAKPALQATTIKVNIRNDRYGQTVAAFSKALPKGTGYSIRESKSGTWFVRDDGSLFGTGTLTFTLTGPCVFRYSVDGLDPVEEIVGANERSRTVKIPSCDRLVYEYLFSGGDAAELLQGVKCSFRVVEGAATAVKLSGKLPSGLTLEADPMEDAWFVRGVPAQTGDFYAELLDAAKSVIAKVAYSVRPLRSAVGTFTGLARTVDTANNHPKIAKVTLTAAANGKLSAKVVIAGKTYSFAGMGYAGWDRDDGGRTFVRADLVQSQKVTRGGRAVTMPNRLRCVVPDTETTDSEAWYAKGPRLTLEMAALPDPKGSGFQADVVYVGELVRDNAKVSGWTSEVARYAAYYTLALVPKDVPDVPVSADDGLPRGNGYATLTVDAKGKLKYAGALPDGTSFSGSATAALGTLSNVPSVRLPLFASKGVGVFGGWLAVGFPAGRAPGGNIAETDAEVRPMVAEDPDSDGLFWFSDDSNATFKGQFGFELGYEPVGGWYDTLVNLQRFYFGDDFDTAFALDTASGDDLWQLRELLGNNAGTGYDFVAEASADGMAVDLSVNGLLVDKSVMAKDSTKSFYEWSACVNPANVKLSFKRATGVYTGTCSLWYEKVDVSGSRSQKSFSNCRHAGVWLMTRGESENLPLDVVGAGSVVVPQTVKLFSGSKRTWKPSFRFNVRATDVPQD